MKEVKFRKKLAEQIIRGEKNITWRLFDDKNLSKGDIVKLIIWETRGKFGEAKLTSVKEKTFKELTKEDKKDHEKFSSDKEMYATYSKYYQKEITPNTKLKVIKFKLLK